MDKKASVISLGRRRVLHGLRSICLAGVLAFLSAASAHAGHGPDLSNNGVVDQPDLDMVKASFGKRCGQAGFDAGADLNHDCVIDVRDLYVVSRNIGQHVNLPPVVQAGSDLAVMLPDEAELAGSVSDDGLPSPTQLSSAWTQVSGPGTVSFANPAAAETTARFSEAGVYVLRLSASDGSLAASDDVTVTVTAGGGGVSLIVEPSEVAIRPGSRARVLVRVVRDAGVSDDIEIAVANAPNGFFVDSALLPVSAREAALRIAADANVPVGTPVSLTLVASVSGVAAHSVVLKLNVLPPAPPPVALIGAALDAGRIDLPTSLLYRMYALFGDPRLPAEYWGSGEGLEDGTLFTEIELVLATLPQAIREELNRFLVRPADPQSIFNVRSTVSKAAVSALSTTPAAASLCVDRWASAGSTVYPSKFKVWLYCNGEDQPDAIRRMLEKIVSDIEHLWKPMTDLMGEPLEDLGDLANGGDTAIDFYAIPPLSLAAPGGRDVTVPVGAVGGAREAPPPESYVGQGKSGYVAIPRDEIFNVGFYSNLVHEFFHVLQKRHNGFICFRAPGDCKLYWFVEATATWAESHFVRTTGSDREKANLRHDPHDHFVRDFQTSSDRPLHLSVSGEHPDFLHMYGAYIWPFFAEQETGGPQVIADMWRALESTTNWTEHLAAISSPFAFAAHFSDFARRNLNSTKLFDGQNPLGRRYVDLEGDPKHFPDNVEPTQIHPHKHAPGPRGSVVPEDVLVVLGSLEIQYHDFEPFGTVGVGTWEFDFSGVLVPPDSSLVIDAFIKTKKGVWTERKNLPITGLVKFCDAERILLVLSNHALANPGISDKTVTGEFTANAISDLCEPQWTGTIECKIELSGPGYQHSETQRWEVVGTPKVSGEIEQYPVTWTTTGTGSARNSSGSTSSVATWTTTAISNGILSVFQRQSDNKRVFGRGNAQLRVQGGVIGQQRLTIDGKPQPPTPIRAEAFEYQYDDFDAPIAATVVSGSRAYPAGQSNGPLAPAGTSGQVQCEWLLTHP